MQFATALQRWLRRLSIGLGAVSLLCLSANNLAAAAPQSTASPDQLQKSATWSWPDVALVEQHLVSYLDQVQASDAIREKVKEKWKSTESANKGPALLERILEVSALVEPRIGELMQQLNDPEAKPVHAKDISWLASDVPGWLQDAIRLACGRALAQRRMYDEALETLSGLDLKLVCDPASLIFYRAICQHNLLQKKECLANVDLLLERSGELPARFNQVAQLISADIKPLKTDSLDEVARLMNDVQRRLELGRAGKRVRDEEQEIIDKLDKMIEQLEDQISQQEQQQQQQKQGDQKKQQGQSKPMDDSQVAGGPKGSGDVDQKDIGKRDKWGNLPPAERHAALQRLTQELPSHYRPAIEGYFRQIAKDNK